MKLIGFYLVEYGTKGPVVSVAGSIIVFIAPIGVERIRAMNLGATLLNLIVIIYFCGTCPFSQKPGRNATKTLHSILARAQLDTATTARRRRLHEGLAALRGAKSNRHMVRGYRRKVGFPSPPRVSCPTRDVRFAKCGLNPRLPSNNPPGC